MHQMNSFFALLPDRLWQWLRQSNPEVSSHIQLFLRGSGLTPWQLMALADRLDLDYLSLAHRVGLITALTQLISSSVDTKKSDQLKKKILYFVNFLTQEINIRNKVNPILIEIKKSIQNGNFNILPQNAIETLEDADEKAQQLNLPKLSNDAFHALLIKTQLDELRLTSAHKELISSHVRRNERTEEIKKFIGRSNGRQELIFSIENIFRLSNIFAERKTNQITIVNPDNWLRIKTSTNEKEKVFYLKKLDFEVLRLLGEGNGLGFISKLITNFQSDDIKNSVDRISRAMKPGQRMNVYSMLILASDLNLIQLSVERRNMYLFALKLIEENKKLHFEINNGEIISVKILQIIQKGKSTVEIQKNLGISIDNVYQHVRKWAARLGIDELGSTESKMTLIRNKSIEKNWIVPDLPNQLPKTNLNEIDTPPGLTVIDCGQKKPQKARVSAKQKAD